ncbi:MAG: hypothetical protein HPY50_06725 [Firmicutes bacterium]|nr:hypothetical protein [Bacillota bacterium]
MYKKFIQAVGYNVKFILLILTGVTFIKALLFPNSMDVLILFLLALILLGLG